MKNSKKIHKIWMNNFKSLEQDLIKYLYKFEFEFTLTGC